MAKNKLAKFAEMHRFSNLFQPAYEELQENGFPQKGKWNEYFGNNHPITAEMGCGKGEYTVALARKFPEKNFIGIDIKGARMYTGAKTALDEGLKNAAFVRTKIENAGFFFGAGEISEIWLTFPDPQMKNRGRRLTSTRFLQLYLRFLQPGGMVHLKTDSAFLYAYTSSLVNLNQFRIQAQTGDIHASGMTGELLSIRTFYENQWLERGIPVKYLAFVPEAREELAEPEEEFEKDTYRSFGRSARP